jgi:hypothetical protein
MTLNLVARIGLVLIVALPLAARAQAETPPRPDRNPLQERSKSSQEPSLPGAAPTVAWTDAEIAKAKAKCTKLLAGLALDYEPLPPIKEGLCGAPAPILVRSVGGDPKVAIEPAATINCAVAAALEAWLRETVQPEAKAAFGSPVVRLQNAASYSCRNRNGGAHTPLSEHALANALDISEFVLASGERVAVLDSWPRVVASEPSLPEPNPERLAEATGAIAPLPELKPKPPVSRTRPAGRGVLEVVKARPEAPPIPLPVAKPPPPKPLSARKTAFVHAVHDAACKTFGTVLGPDSDEAHKSHFHFDMKARRSVFCQ